MKKVFLVGILSAACLLGISTSAFANSPIGSLSGGAQVDKVNITFQAGN